MFVENLSKGYLRWTRHPVILTIRDSGDYIRVLLHSYSTTCYNAGGLPKVYPRDPNMQTMLRRAIWILRDMFP